MKKKIKPAEQTKKLQKANWEFFKRNKNKFEEFLEKEKIESISDLCERYNTTREEMEDWLSEGKAKPAIVNFLYASKAYFRAGKRYCESLNMSLEQEEDWVIGGGVPTISPERFDEFYMEELLKDSKKIIRALISDRPRQSLLVSIDLDRSTDAIVAEIKKIVESEKRGMQEKRLKWLPKIDELLEVWDLYDRAGRQPAKRTFRQIAKKVGRPLSTVKSQWYMAYEKIFGKPYAYDPESKYSTEEKKALADALCAKCPHGAKCCGKDDFYPCSDYLKISGIDKEEYMKKKRLFVEYKDGIAFDE